MIGSVVCVDRSGARPLRGIIVIGCSRSNTIRNQGVEIADPGCVGTAPLSGRVSQLCWKFDQAAQSRGESQLVGCEGNAPCTARLFPENFLDVADLFLGLALRLIATAFGLEVAITGRFASRLFDLSFELFGRAFDFVASTGFHDA